MIADKLGREIKIDDIIAYPIKVGDTLRLRIGRVLKLAEGKISVRGVDDSYPDRTLVVTEMVTDEYRRLLGVA